MTAQETAAGLVGMLAAAGLTARVHDSRQPNGAQWVVIDPAPGEPEPLFEVPARPLPNGRGFLRLVGGAGGPSPAAPTPPPVPAPARPVEAAPAATATALRFDEYGQADLFSWTPPKRDPVQLDLFGAPGDDGGWS